MYGAFFDELSKIAEEAPPTDWGKGLKTMLGGGLAMGLGGAVGHQIGGRVVPAVFDQLSDDQIRKSKYMVAALGAGGGLALNAALRKQRELTRPEEAEVE